MLLCGQPRPSCRELDSLLTHTGAGLGQEQCRVTSLDLAGGAGGRVHTGDQGAGEREGAGQEAGCGDQSQTVAGVEACLALCLGLGMGALVSR